MTTSEIIRTVLIIGLIIFLVVWRSGLGKSLKEAKEKKLREEREAEEARRRAEAQQKAKRAKDAQIRRTSQILRTDLEGLRQKSTLVGGDTQWYLEGGETSPEGTVLLLHGFAGQKEDWNAFAAPLLERKFHVVAPDLPGFGQNEKHEHTNYEVTSQAKRIRAFAKALDLTSFHLVGSSLGGSIAAAYTYAAPDQVMTLTLIEPFGVRVPYETPLDQYLARDINPFAIGTPEAYDHLLGFLFETPPEMPEAVKLHRARETAENRAFYLKMWPQIRGGDRAYLLDLLLPEIKKKTLVLQGEKSKVVHPATAQMITNAVEGATAVVMPDCGHFPAVEKPQEAAALFLRFLDQVPGARSAPVSA